jgi:hypothetical protein
MVERRGGQGNLVLMAGIVELYNYVHLTTTALSRFVPRCRRHFSVDKLPTLRGRRLQFCPKGSRPNTKRLTRRGDAGD